MILHAMTTCDNDERPSVHFTYVSIDDECNTQSCESPDSPPCFELLRQFYQELMEPTFPLAELDDLNDWFECFRSQMKRRKSNHPEFNDDCTSTEDSSIHGRTKDNRTIMDVILMILDSSSDKQNTNDTGSRQNRSRRYLRQSRRLSSFGGLYAPVSDDNKGNLSSAENPVIIGGVAVEYYRESQVGLVSYIVLQSRFRGGGLASDLHTEALSRLEKLACRYNLAIANLAGKDDSRNQKTFLKAIFAESNTAAAGDVPPEQCLLRHKALYKLGYRLMNFPYAQPPLSIEDIDASFDEILLLVYFPFIEENVLPLKQVVQEFIDHGIVSNENDIDTNAQIARRFCSWFFLHWSIMENGDDAKTIQMNVDIPFSFIEDFYKSVFTDYLDGAPEYQNSKYYKLVYWFTHIHTKSGQVEVSLKYPPWDDCKGLMYSKMSLWKQQMEFKV